MRFLDDKRGMHPYRLTEGPKPSVFVFTVDMVPPEFHRQPSPCLPHLQLPALDALRRESVDFRNAFSVSPLCGPSRASLFTGRYPYITVNEERAHDGCEVALRDDDPIYPDYLKAAGYSLGHVGKSHIGTAAFIRAFGEACSPWNRWAPPVYDDPEYHAFLAAQGVDGFRFAGEIYGLKPDHRQTGNFYGGWIEQKDGSPFPMGATYPHYLVSRAIALLDSLLERRPADDVPLYLQVDLFAPHQPFFIPAGLEEREAALRAVATLPASYTEWCDSGYGPPGPEPRIYSLYRRNWGLYDPDTAMDYAVANRLQMEVVDRALARFIAALRDRGLYDNSLVIFTADHGEMNLENGLVDKGAYGHPKAARIPLFLKLPGGVQAGRTVTPDVCLLDVAPTLLEAAGVEPFARFDGVSLWRVLEEDADIRTSPFVFEAGWHVAPNPGVAIHGHLPEGHLRYVYNAESDFDELYDLESPSPSNLIDEPAYAAARSALRRQLSEILRRDARWRCYRQCFELDCAADLPRAPGDNQMFIPES